MEKNWASQGPLFEAIGHEFDDIVDLHRLIIVFVRLTIAAFLGGLLGYQREVAGKAAGLRTHMLVATGSAFFVLAPELAGIVDTSRVIQGIVAGIGFLGAGAVLKNEDQQQIRGLTTAANIWLTAAIGISVGLGRAGAAFICTLMALLILEAIYRLGSLWDQPAESGTIVVASSSRTSRPSADDEAPRGGHSNNRET